MTYEILCNVTLGEYLVEEDIAVAAAAPEEAKLLVEQLLEEWYPKEKGYRHTYCDVIGVVSQGKLAEEGKAHEHGFDCTNG